MANQPALPLLMLPGTLCDARVFAPVLDAMRAEPAMLDREILYGAMTGHDSVAALGDAILARAPDRFIVVGFSLGAIVALDMAVRAPERIAGLVMIAGNARTVPEADWPMRRAAAATPPGELVGKVLWPRSVGPARMNDADLRNTVVAMAGALPPGTLAAQIEVALSRADQRARLGALTMPTLILGGEHDAIAPPELQREMAQSMPLATLRLVENTGHFLLLERPDACASALSGWLSDPMISQFSPEEAS